VPTDSDGDMICDSQDDDRDGDGVGNNVDDFPDDRTAAKDTDGDGKPDSIVGLSETGLIEDYDDDNDNWSDFDEFECGTDPLDDSKFPADSDEDGICDALDVLEDILYLPFNLTYPSQNLQLTINQEMDSFLANITGAGDVVTWEISGELPEGLTFGWSPARDAAFDGSIRGTPTELMEMTNFTIWANNSAYSQSFEVSLTVIEESISEEVIPEEVIPEDDDDSERGWMWCFPLLILLLLLLLIPLILGRDKILLMLAEGPEPENTTASPEFISGAGTEEDPFILEPIIDLEPGESASSIEIINIDKMSDIKIEMIDLHQASNGDKFSMYEEQFGTIGVRQLAIGKDGEVTINIKFDDGVDTPTFEGGEYSGLLKLGRASVYLSWSVTVKKDLSKKNKYEKAAKKAAKAEKEAQEADEKEAQEAAEKEAKEVAEKEAKKQAKIQEEADQKALKAAKAKVDAETKVAEEEKSDLAKAAKAETAKKAKEAQKKADEEAEEKAAAKPVTKEAKKQELLKRVKAKASEIDFGILGVASASEKDDLQTLKGIGPFIEEKLNALGIYTFKQISKMKGELEDQVNMAIEFFPGRVKRDQWVMQAKELLKK
jgi:predicted flap endonuclease-1-like 5' DNA nuclease